jgi:cyanate permease
MVMLMLRECVLQNFGVSFSIISVITGIPSLFLFGLVSIFQRQVNVLFPDG